MTTISDTTSILSQVQRIHNTSTGYEVRTTTYTDNRGRVESTTSIYTVYDKLARIENDSTPRYGSTINILV